MDLNIVKFQQFLSMVRRRCNTLDGGAWTLNLKSTLIQTCKVIRLNSLSLKVNVVKMNR